MHAALMQSSEGTPSTHIMLHEASHAVFRYPCNSKTFTSVMYIEQAKECAPVSTLMNFRPSDMLDHGNFDTVSISNQDLIFLPQRATMLTMSNISFNRFLDIMIVMEHEDGRL